MTPKPPILIIPDAQEFRIKDTPELILRELERALADEVPEMDVDANTPDADLDAVLFATDLQAAKAQLLATAFEMYRQRGHSEAEAKTLAEALVNAPLAHPLPGFDDL